MQKTVPVLLTAAVMVVAVAACSGGKSSSSSSTTTASSPAASPALTPKSSALGKPEATATIPPKHMTAKNPKMGYPGGPGTASVGNGASVFTANCSSCHQANGQGQPGVFPPLADNPTVTGPADKVIGIVKNGLSGKIEVKGKTYNGQMPAWKSTLSNADIAHVITYIRSSWGNHAPGVTEAQVAAAK